MAKCGACEDRTGWRGRTVLSEQTMVTQPRVSTAGSRLTITLGAGAQGVRWGRSGHTGGGGDSRSVVFECEIKYDLLFD